MELFAKKMLLFLYLAAPMYGLLYASDPGYGIEFESLSTVYLPYTYTDQGGQFALGMDAAEQMAYDQKDHIIYSVGHTNIHVIDTTDVRNPQILFHVTYNNVDVTDVEVCDKHLFVAFDNQTRREDGFVNVYKVFNRTIKALELLQTITVGDIPDMIHPTTDCTKVIVAIEAEPYDDHTKQGLVDNPGGVGIISFSDTPAGSYTYNVLGFEKFNSRYETLSASGVRWIYKENNNTFANDLEPEYIALNEEETKAYVCLQENNAIAVLDLRTEVIEEIYGLGYKLWMNFTVDPSDRDGGIHMRPWPLYGMYQPDSMKVYRFRGIDYIITANEGDSKDYQYFSEESRVKNLDLSEIFEPNETAGQQMKDDSMLGRLKVTTENGKNTTTGLYDRLYTFGTRSFSIWRADTMTQVYDSGDEIARKTALLHPNLFNSDCNGEDLASSSMDTRSDDKGPETESITMGHIGSHTLLMIGNERPGTIAVYTIDEKLPTIKPRFETLITGILRTNDTWSNLYNSRKISMIDPEDIKFVPADKSPTGKPLLLVSGSTSGTVSILQINFPEEWDETDSVDANRGKHSSTSIASLICVCACSLLLKWN